MSDQDTSTQTPSGTSEEQANTTTGTTVPSAGFSQAAPLLMGVKLPIRVLLGRTQLCLRDIAQLGSGAVVELDCSPDDPVEIIVNDRVIAHGEVVVVSGNYGVRITKIASRQQDQEAENAPSDLFKLSQKLR
ncbi:MAG TPA: flagellar motor switch protein FliN [Bryobacteraceae bacterium]|jgi:flagellar motor switch protein FliN/FliY|nr:flagellar motor switch protein FliN [Bryobacteraceae bacterium]